MHLTLRLHPHHSVVTVDGSITEDAVHSLVDSFAIVPDEHPLVLDLVAVDSIDDRAVVVVRDEVVRRSGRTVVALDPHVVEVAVRLIINELDLVSTFADGLEAALYQVEALLPR